MNRTFSTREKILLLVLAVLLLGCFYYVAVLQPSLSAQKRAQTELASVQDQLVVQQALAVRMATLEQQLEEAQASGMARKTLPAYDNTKNEIAELNGILAEADSYSIEFSEPDLESSPVRRAVSISFTAGTYDAAHSVVQKLIDCQYSCLVSDIAMTGTGLGQASDSGQVTATVSVTFFEQR